MENLSDKYLNKIIAQKLFDGPGDPPDTLEGLNANDFTAVVYNAVKEIIENLKESGELKADQNLDAAGITAQILLETGNGKSSLASKYNNFGGIKAGKYWKGETIMIPNSDGNVDWRVYPSVKKGLEEQVRFFLPSKNPRYFKAGVLSAKNAAEHAKRVQEAGYAGDQKDYADRVIKMANSINKRLQKANPDYSKGATYQGFKVEDNVPESTSYQESTGQDFIQQSLDQPITIGNPNPASVFLNDNTRVELNAPIEISNPSTKIFDNSFYNDNRNKEQIVQSKKNQSFIDSPVKLRTGGYINRFNNGGTMYSKYFANGGPGDGEDEEEGGEGTTSNGLTGALKMADFILNAGKLQYARAMQKKPIPEQGDLSDAEYYKSLSNADVQNLKYTAEMNERDVGVEKGHTSMVQNNMGDIAKKLSLPGTSMKYDYDYLGIPWMGNTNSWFHKMPDTKNPGFFIDPFSCQGVACAIARKAGAVNAADYVKGKKGDPWTIETGSGTVDNPKVHEAKGMFPMPTGTPVQKGDIYRMGHKTPDGTDHNVVATDSSYEDAYGGQKIPSGYASHWSDGVKSHDWDVNEENHTIFRYLRNTHEIEKRAAKSRALYNNYMFWKNRPNPAIKTYKGTEGPNHRLDYVNKNTVVNKKPSVPFTIPQRNYK